MGKDLLQAVYVSFTTKHFDSSKDIESILEASWKNNKDLGISGILLYRGGVFLQYVEGPEQNIENLLTNKIEKDPRHTKIKYFLRQKTDHRLFESWEMAFHEVSKDELALEMVNAVLDWNIAIDKVQSTSTIADDMILKMLSEIGRFVQVDGLKKQV